MTKILGLLIASFLVIATLGIVSAATTFSVSPTTVSFGKFDASKSFTMTNSNTANPLAVNIGTLPTINGVALSRSGYTNGDDFNSSTVTLNRGTIDWNTFDLGKTYSGTFLISDDSNSAENATVTVEIVNDNFCEYTNDGDLSVKIDSVDNLGIGDDETWYPLDQINVDLEIKNKGSDDVDNIEVEWGLYDESAGEWIIEIQNEDEIDVNEDDSEIVSFSIDIEDDLEVDMSDLEDGEYTLYVRATGIVNDDNETTTCGSASDTIEIRVEKDYVMANDIKITGTPLCGSVLQLSADISNIGSDDQNDVTVEILSTEFGINEIIEMGDIDAFDSKSLSLEFQVPEGIAEKSYRISLKVYDEDEDIYENSDNDEASFYTSIDVSGNCIVTPKANVLASLESGGKPGQEMQIKASVSNTGSVQDTFTIEAADYSSWAELVSIEPANVVVAKGASKDVILTFNVNSDATDKQTFNIILTDSKGASITQPIAVAVSQGFSLRALSETMLTYGQSLLQTLFLLEL